MVSTDGGKTARGSTFLRDVRCVRVPPALPAPRAAPSECRVMSAREDVFRWLDGARESFRQFGVTAVDPDRFLAELADRLRTVFAAADEELLTLPEAARRAGMSEDHLGRLLREGKVPNAGRKGRPRVRAADLPRRTRRAFATPVRGAYDPSADARALRSRRGERA